jgi:hypothetical protein
MFRRIVQSKFLAIFISAFLCLNLSGSLCLAYCQVKTAETEHCPLAKPDAESCPMSKGLQKTDSTPLTKIAKGHTLDCCTPAINYFAAPLEKHQFSFQIADVPAEKTFSFSPTAAFEQINFQSDFSYRKPLYDYRKARLKNCVFLI